MNTGQDAMIKFIEDQKILEGKVDTTSTNITIMTLWSFRNKYKPNLKGHMVDYENPWMYEGRAFLSEDIGDNYGFVYKITNSLNGREYIGRKYFVQKRKPKGGKRRVTSESDWKKYYGSCPELKEDIKKYGKQNFSREILSIHTTLGKVNYEETRQLFVQGVLTESLDNGVPRFYNSNVLVYYRKDYFHGTRSDE